MLFSSSSGVTAYDGLTGLWLWSLRGAVPESTDPSQGRFYLTQGTSLLEVDPTSGQVLARASGSAVAGSAGLFAVRNGVALGLDQGANGEAWGYDVSTQQVVWTASRVPWPHYFVDLGGLGGSAEPDGAKVIVAACGKLGPKSAPSPSAPSNTNSTNSTTPPPRPAAPAAPATPKTRRRYQQPLKHQRAPAPPPPPVQPRPPRPRPPRPGHPGLGPPRPRPPRPRPPPAPSGRALPRPRAGRHLPLTPADPADPADPAGPAPNITGWTARQMG